MFFCEPCRRRRDWPMSMSRSAGICELCNEGSICYDVPSSQLPLPPLAPQFETDIDMDARLAAMGFVLAETADDGSQIWDVPAGHPAEEIINRTSANEGVRMTRPPRRQK